MHLPNDNAAGVSSSFATTTAAAATTTMAHQTTRGGGDVASVAPPERPTTTAIQQQPQPYVAVSTVVWGTQPENRSLATFFPGCHLSSSSASGRDAPPQGQVLWVGKGQWDDSRGGNTPALWKTLSFLSDVLVLVLNTREPIELALVNALEAGFQARLKDMPKGRFLIVLHGDHTPEEIREWKDRLSSTLEGSAPRIVDELSIVPAPDYATTLQQMKKRCFAHPGVSQLADAETFPSLVQQVHRAFGGIDPPTRNLLLVSSEDGDNALVRQPEQIEQIEPEPEVEAPPPAVVATAAPTPSSSTSTVAKKATPAVPPAAPVVPAAAVTAAVAKPTAPATTRSTPRHDPELEVRLLGMVNELCDQLQLLQENVWLDGNKAKGTTIRPINFAAQANPRLHRLAQAVLEDSVPDSVRTKVAAHLKGRLRTLYQQQLEALRDASGRRYEAALAKTVPAQWRKAATRTTDEFRKASERAVPTLLQPGQLWEDLDWNYYRSVAESGLISDMMQATDARQDPASLLDEMDDDDDAVGSSSSKRLAKWYEKLAARALVLGVNYLQGWLAWQGIKRAALLREQQMPKFPLF